MARRNWSRWQHRIMMIVPADERDGDNAAHTLHWPGGDAEALTFGVPLSATGHEPATHHGSYTSCTDALWAAMQALMDDGYYPGMVWYRLDRNQTTLVETNSPTATLGVPWEWTDALSDLGLRRMEDQDGISS